MLDLRGYVARPYGCTLLERPLPRRPTFASRFDAPDAGANTCATIPQRSRTRAAAFLGVNRQHKRWHRARPQAARRPRGAAAFVCRAAPDVPRPQLPPPALCRAATARASTSRGDELAINPRLYYLPARLTGYGGESERRAGSGPARVYGNQVLQTMSRHLRGAGKAGATRRSFYGSRGRLLRRPRCWPFAGLVRAVSSAKRSGVGRQVGVSLLPPRRPGPPPFFSPDQFTWG
jgi:hypothetical protein